MSAYIDLDRQFRDLTEAERESPDSLAFQDFRSLRNSSAGWSTIIDSQRVIILAEAGTGKTRELQAQCRRLLEQGRKAFFIPIEELNESSVEDIRQELSKPLIDDLKPYMEAQLAKLSKGDDLAKALNYMLKRWASFTRFLDDGRVCLSNNAAERAVRGVALGRKSWLFAGSDRGGERAAAMYSLIYTCRLNEVDPQAYLADVLARINGHPNLKIGELLPWNWRVKSSAPIAA